MSKPPPFLPSMDEAPFASDPVPSGSDVLPSSDPSGARRRRLWRILQWGVVGVALVYLGREGAWSRDRLALTGRAWAALPAAFALLALSAATLAFRFHGLLRCLDCPSDRRGHVRLVFAGVLAQQVGSDLAYDLVRFAGARRMGGGGAAVFAALMVDRLAGLAGLALWAAWMLRPWIGGAGWLATAGGVALAVAVPLSLAAWHGWWTRRRTEERPPWPARLPGAEWAAAVGESVRAFHGRYVGLARALGWAVLGHGLIFAALYACGQALPPPCPTPTEAFTGGALSAFTQLLPLPMAGLGVGEAAFGEAIARMRGTGEAGDFAAVFLVNRLLLWGLGTLSWLWLAARRRTS